MDQKAKSLVFKRSAGVAPEVYCLVINKCHFNKLCNMLPYDFGVQSQIG